jgi:hypothetical protein
LASRAPGVSAGAPVEGSGAAAEDSAHPDGAQQKASASNAAGAIGVECTNL